MTPELFTQWFDGVAVVLVLLWGIAVKYAPGIAKLPNFLIGWLGVVLAALLKFAAPEAHAAVGDAWVMPWWLSAPLQVFWASNAYERFVRPVLEKIGIYKARETKRGTWTWTHEKPPTPGPA